MEMELLRGSEAKEVPEYRETVLGNKKTLKID
jgi:hypothetical protein